jgi:hypothetical protein
VFDKGSSKVLSFDPWISETKGASWPPELDFDKTKERSLRLNHGFGRLKNKLIDNGA